MTVRLIAQNGILQGKGGELYLQGEAATGKISLPPPLAGREYHLFCSPFNAGATEVAEELAQSDVYVTKGKAASAPLTHTSDISKLNACDHMLVLLDARTWTSGEDTAKLVEHIHEAMRLGVHVNCVHEYPAVIGPPRHTCDFGLMFNDDWTPAHLTSGPTNLYKEIALALTGMEWRKPGLVALAAKIAGSAHAHKPIDVKVPATYEALSGPNPHLAAANFFNEIGAPESTAPTEVKLAAEGVEVKLVAEESKLTSEEQLDGFPPSVPLPLLVAAKPLLVPPATPPNTLDGSDGDDGQSTAANGSQFMGKLALAFKFTTGRATISDAPSVEASSPPEEAPAPEEALPVDNEATAPASPRLDA